MSKTETENKDLPKCHFCKEEMVEGDKFVTTITKRTMYICLDCREIIGAIAHDAAYNIFNDITNIMSSENNSWKEILEPWSYEEAEAK